MLSVVMYGAAMLIGVGLCLLGVTSAYCPELLRKRLNRSRYERAQRGRATGRPIEDIAGDLRRSLAEHDRILVTSSKWLVGHDLRVCEHDLHDLAEEAATALQLTPCSAAIGCSTTLHLAVRLRELADAGLTLPRYAGLGNDRP
jgi:hypothetical protein